MKTYEEILNYVEKCGSSVLRDAPPYFIQQVPEEISALLFELSKTGGYSNFMEIGSAAGGTSRLLNDFFHFHKMIVMDNNSHNKKMVKVRREQLAGLPVHEFNGDSGGMEAKEFVRASGADLDILFIDGDHSYKGVKADFDNHVEFVRKGGYVIFHDTVSYPGVRRFVDELRSDGGVSFVKEFTSEAPRVCGLGLFRKI